MSDLRGALWNDENMADPALGPGPVHYVRSGWHSPNGAMLSTCGQNMEGCLYNVDGPTSCPACLEALARETERVLEVQSDLKATDDVVHLLFGDWGEDP